MIQRSSSLLRSLWHFLLHDGLGRLLLITLAIVSMHLLATLFLSLLPTAYRRLLWQSLLLCCLTLALWRYTRLRRCRLQTYIGTGEDLHRVYRHMSTAQRAPIPPCWAFGGNVQFIPWMLYNMFSAKLQPLNFEKQRLRVRGLQDKTRPESDENRRVMEDEVILNFFPPTSSSLKLDAPAIIVEPGLTCTAQDVPGSSFLRRAAHRGFRVVVVERRGHAEALRSARWNLFGDAEDSERVIDRVQETLRGAPLFWIGFSSGSKLPIEAQGKFDARRERGEAAPSFVAIACVAPGYDLETCFLGFHWPYRQMCLSSTKSRFLLENEEILKSYDAEAFDRAVNAKDLQELLAHAAPFAGYGSSEEYFRHENPVLFAPSVRTPCLILNAMDDPLTVPGNAFKTMPGQADGPSFAEMVAESSCGLLLMAPSGSHCPFLDGQLPFTKVARSLGTFTLSCWADSCVLEFFEGFLAESLK